VIRWVLCALGLAAALSAAPAVAGVVPTFRGLGGVPGGYDESAATGVSGDGSVVVGCAWTQSTWTQTQEGQAFRWTAATGTVGLGIPVGGEMPKECVAVSADGTTIVETTWYGWFRWREGKPSDYRFDPIPEVYLTACGVSADGSVIVGRHRELGGQTRAIRWTDDWTGTFLPGLEEALGVSADGSVVVGRTGQDAIRWTASGGAQVLGKLANAFGSTAHAVSADGEVVVGGSGGQAFRWTQATGMIGLGDLPGGEVDSVAFGVSADGSVVVGTGCSAPHSSEAFVWTPANGIQSLHDVLAYDYGLDLTGWRLVDAYAVSADGHTIVGEGVGPRGRTEAWVATIPEPGTLLLLAVGCLGLLRRARNRLIGGVCEPETHMEIHP